MWVYIETERNIWTVGFYDPDGKFKTDSDHDDREKAGERVAFLNGGPSMECKDLREFKEAVEKHWGPCDENHPVDRMSWADYQALLKQLKV